MTQTIEDRVTVTISGIRQGLVEDIDKLAAADRRPRSRWLEIEIEQIVERKKAKEAKK